MNDQEKIIINGNAFSFKPGETILAVAGRNHIDIPTLCHLKGASPTGNCRICVVNVENEKDLLPSCANLAEAGMVVHTESPEVVKARRLIIQLMLLGTAQQVSVINSLSEKESLGDGGTYTITQQTPRCLNLLGGELVSDGLKIIRIYSI